MHFNRIGCRLHNLLCWPTASYSSVSALTFLSPDLFSLFPPPSSPLVFSFFFFYLGTFLRSLRKNDRISLFDPLGKFRLCDWAFDLCPIEFHGRRIVHLRSPSSREAREGGQHEANDCRTDESAQLRLLVEIRYSQIDCVYASPNDNVARRHRGCYVAASCSYGENK